MNKELTPLEALDLLPKKYGANIWKCEEYDIVKNALKDYEKKTKLAKEYDDVNNVAKRLKALKIIKEKKVDTSLLRQVFDNEKHIPNPLFYYNNFVDNYSSHYPLTQEEYELLKEVLL